MDFISELLKGFILLDLKVDFSQRKDSRMILRVWAKVKAV